MCETLVRVSSREKFAHMGYTLGVDLGTTYTAAAIRRGDRLEVADLGTRAAAMPSVVYLRDDGAVLTGEAALRRGVTDPGRMSREFKRRMGDTTAILLGGVPWSVDGLMARMLQSVVAAVTERQGEPPSAIAVAHPANWGPYKKDLLEQAVRRADLDHVRFITEPEAAAVHYATLERLESGDTVAVYDLGGGTFDAAVLRKTADGFELVGEPEGIERLGGIDFDEAVFRHVLASLGGVVAELDHDDPVVQAAVSRLRDECVAAKEALSSDTEVSIPVILPNVHTDVRLTRAEFEAMIRPALGDTLVVLQRALRSAGVKPDDLHSVLLVGGSSRIPLISQLVSAELGRPVALDVHPKHSVALGAAVIAGGPVAMARPVVVVPPTEPVPAVPSSPVASSTPVLPPPASVTTAAAEAAAPTAPMPAVAPPVQAAPAASAPTSPMVTMAAPPAPPASGGTPPPPPTGPTFSAPPAEPSGGTKRSRTGLFVGLGVAAAIVLGIGGAIVLGGGGDDDGAAAETTEPEATGTTAGTGTTAATATTTETTTAPTEATDPTTTVERTTVLPTTTTRPPACQGVTEPCIELNAVDITGTGAVEVTWTPFNFEPDVQNGYHAHLYWSNKRADECGNQTPGIAPDCAWDAHDETVHTSSMLLIATKPPGAKAVCVTVGLAPAHNVPNPELFDCRVLPDP